MAGGAEVCLVSVQAASPINRHAHTLRQQVQELLQNRIVSGELPAGSRLNETELAAELKVSRGPVREALQGLTSAGLIVMEPHRGAYVRSLDDHDVAELFELRIALETHAARLAARNASPALRRELEELVAATQVVIQSSDDAHYPMELDLHEVVISACGVARLEREVSAINKQLALARARSGYQPRRAKTALVEHVEIVRNVSAGDESGAVEAMYHHLRAAADHSLHLAGCGS